MTPTYTDNATAEIVVVLPVCRPDYHLALRWLEWSAELARQPGAQLYPLIVMFVPGLTHDQSDALENAALGLLAKFECFHGLQDGGYWKSPNVMFRKALELAEKNNPGHAMLWVEPDTVPMRPTWFNEIQEEYRHCSRPFMGDFVIAGQIIPHLTGNAVYSADWRKHAPSLAALPQPRPEQGWDSLCAHETFANAHQAKTIQQIWRPPPITREYAQQNIRKETALFHQCKDGSLSGILAAEMGVPLRPLEQNIANSDYNGGKRPVEKKKNVTELLIVTFSRDIPFLRYCLRSIELFATGFAGVTLLVPAHERGQYDWVSRSVRVEYFDEPAGKGMLAHELQIMKADEWCPNADVIVHLDADTIWWERVTPDILMPRGKPIIVREAFAKITNSNRHVWKVNVENAIGITPAFDTMVRHPQVYTRATYAKARELIERKTGRTVEWFIMSQRNEFPQTFAEHPTLGCVADKFFAEEYEFEEFDKAALARVLGLEAHGDFQYVYRPNHDRLVETWSHGGIERYRALLDGVLKGQRPSYVVK